MNHANPRIRHLPERIRCFTLGRGYTGDSLKRFAHQHGMHFSRGSLGTLYEIFMPSGWDEQIAFDDYLEQRRHDALGVKSRKELEYERNKKGMKTSAKRDAGRPDTKRMPEDPTKHGFRTPTYMDAGQP